MLGLVSLGLTTFMIYTLVKNALRGKQLSAEDVYPGTIDLLIPITNSSKFHFEAWRESLANFKGILGRVKIHLLIDGHHPLVHELEALKSQFSFVEIHPFLMRPNGTQATPWMIQQMANKLSSEVVIIGDPEIAATEAAFLSTGKLIAEKGLPYFILPQTAKLSLVNEAIANLNPTLSLVSVFGFRKFRKAISHPLMSLAEGWIAMPLSTLKELDIQNSTDFSWKQALAKYWYDQGKTFYLAFGEKHLKRFYNVDFKAQLKELKTDWEFYWNNSDRTGLWLYLVTIFLWSFPILCFYSNPFASIMSLFLLILYRFFTKIVFQESWGALALHFVGSLALVGTFLWWAFEGLKSKYQSQGPKRIT